MIISFHIYYILVLCNNLKLLVGINHLLRTTFRNEFQSVMLTFIIKVLLFEETDKNIRFANTRCFFTLQQFKSVSCKSLIK